jgi:predicted RNA binding protein YcfA (HicA-like mRNA interferase family)
MPGRKRLVERFKGRPTDFTWDEFGRMMASLGYEMMAAKGSARRFFKKGKRRILYMHEPHPRKELKAYQVRQALEVLQENGDIER